MVITPSYVNTFTDGLIMWQRMSRLLPTSPTTKTNRRQLSTNKLWCWSIIIDSALNLNRIVPNFVGVNFCQ